MPTIITAQRLRQQVLNIGQMGDSSTLSETWDIDVTLPTWAAEDVEQDAAGPARIRTRHSTMTNYVCTRVQVRQITVGHWQMDAEFTSRAGSEDYCKITRRGTTRMMDAWKYTAGTFPANGTTVWPPTTAAVGASVDIFGTPRQVMSAVTDISIDVYYDRSASVCAFGSATHWPVVWTAAQNRRNSAVWLGLPIGNVVFLGYSEALTEDPWVTATLHFRADSLYHLEQKVLPSADGKVLLGASSTWDGNFIAQATKAYWYQPFGAALLDFNTLHSGAFGQLTSPTPPCLS